MRAKMPPFSSGWVALRLASRWQIPRIGRGPDPSNVANGSLAVPDIMTWLKRAVLALVILSIPLPIPVLAQRGDKKGEAQVARVPKDKIPPAPPLAPDEALTRFKLQPGYRLELVAAEPMVDTPVVLQFDPDGRLWVVEMRGFMPDADGVGEDQTNGRIAILEDTNGDGRADTNKVFLDGLVLPRALLLVNGGVLVGEPPNLWFYPNVNDQPGERVQVATDFGSRANPEHTANSLVLAMDNWIYALYHPWRYRFRAGRWERERVPQRAQWGQAQDDFGRLYYTSNSDHLRGDAVPPHYFGTNTSKSPGIGVAIAKDQTVWPGRVNPGVNRGYQPGTLRADGTLARFTAACGTAIYRGDALPRDCWGNAFVCEPSANCVRRSILSESGGVVSARNACDKSEFLTSTDELFRPVNALGGPDGALYLADMYRGIIQHRIYLTSYLRSQSEERGLDNVIHRGRIWRVAGATASRRERPNLSQASSAELVKALEHPNGWWRDTAQRLLVERADASVAPLLRQLAVSGASPVPRLHALWTMEGMQVLSSADVDAALADKQPKVRAVGIRLAEPFLKGAEASVWRDRIMKFSSDAAAEVQIQLALTVGQSRNEPKVLDYLASLAKNSSTPLARDVAGQYLPQPKKAPAVAAKVVPLTAEEQKRFEAGKGLYEQVCLACHQQHGQGQPGLAPPLVGAEWVGFSEQRLIRIVLQGLRGKVKVKGEEFEMDMPALGVLDDEQIAAVLTYVRREWGHTYPAVSPAAVQQVRKATETREDAWTAPELLKIP